MPEPCSERDSSQRGQPGPGPDPAFPAPGAVCPWRQEQYRLSAVQHGVVRCPTESLGFYGRNWNYIVVAKVSRLTDSILRLILELIIFTLISILHVDFEKWKKK